MQVALSNSQAFSLVVACAAVAVFAIALPPGRAGVLAVTFAALFAVWVRDAGSVAGAGAMLALALVTGLMVRQRRAQAIEHEQSLVASVAAADARREADVLGERARLAREIHDVLAHTLAGLAIQLERTRLLAADLPSAENVEQELARAHEIATTGLEEARSAVGALRGEQHTDEEAIRRLATEFAETLKVSVEVESRGNPDGLAPERQLLLYRTVQEALTNAARHAKPTTIVISLDYSGSDAAVSVENDDQTERNNDDATTHPTAAGWGLEGMRERVMLAGGQFDAGPTDSGFHVAVKVPR